MKRRRQAFTLIELVASAVLAAMMMIALMNVVWSATRDARMLKKTDAARASTTLLADRLRTDFQNARGITVGGNDVILQGYLSEDPKTSDPTLLPATVQYQIVSVREHRVLLRTVNGPGGSKSEPVWIGMGALQIEPLAEVDAEDMLQPDPAAGGLAPMPTSLRVTLTSHDGYLLWREVLHHHEI